MNTTPNKSAYRVAFTAFCATLLAGVLVFGSSNSVRAQGHKIGYCSVELILGLMPEAKSMESVLRTQEGKLKEQLEIKQRYLQAKLEEYQSRAETLTPDQRKATESELQKLNDEIQKSAGEAQNSFDKKKQELLEPIVEKLQKAIDDVAAESGYTHVINSSIGGNSVLIKGPKEDNITLKVLKKLNVEIPKEIEEGLLNPDKKPAPKPAGTEKK